MNECEGCDRHDCRERGCIAPIGENKMKVKINRPVEVEPSMMEVYLKVRDEFSFSIKDTNGNVIAEQDVGYVPSFFPGDYGDYVDLKIDVRTGTITNWDQRFAEKLQAYIDDKERDR